MTQHTPSSGLDPQVGDVVAGKYRLERLLGAGGMGMVFSANHLELERLVAVKFVHAAISENPEISARFLREARAVVKIESEHVAKVLDVGNLDDGTPYMVMEYLDGQDLSDCGEGVPFQIPDAVDYVIQTCSAMLEAHAMGIVHRDLKPANLFLTYRRDGTPLVKVLDFGISKWNEPEPSAAALTNPSVLMGSPAYMSPEQLRSARDVDHRTDIWSLGTILYELLAARPAFDAESLPLLMTAIMRDGPPPLRSLRPDVDEELERVILRCLDKDPAARYQSMAEFASALAPWAPARSQYNLERLTRVSGLPPPRNSWVPPAPSAVGAAPGAAAGSSAFQSGEGTGHAAHSRGEAAVGGQRSSSAVSVGAGSSVAPASSTSRGRDETAGTWAGTHSGSDRRGGSGRRLALALALAGVAGAGGAFLILGGDTEPLAGEPPGSAATGSAATGSAPERAAPVAATPSAGAASSVVATVVPTGAAPSEGLDGTTPPEPPAPAGSASIGAGGDVAPGDAPDTPVPATSSSAAEQSSARFPPSLRPQRPQPSRPPAKPRVYPTPPRAANPLDMEIK